MRRQSLEGQSPSEAAIGADDLGAAVESTGSVMRDERQNVRRNGSHRTSAGRSVTYIRAGACVLLCCALAACGSTVQGAGIVAAPGAGASVTGDGLAVPQSGTGGTAGGESGSSGGIGAEPAPGSASAEETGAGQPTSASAGSSGSAGSNGAGGPLATEATSAAGPTGTARGVTATTIKIGVYTAQGMDSAHSAIGSKVSTGDHRAMAMAVVNWINSHGGAAGRKLVPVFHNADTSRAASSPDAEYEAACAAWTEDDSVYAVASPVGTVGESLYACLAKKQVIASASQDPKDAGFFKRYADYFYGPADFNITRMLRNNVNALHAGGYFSAWNHLSGEPGTMPVKVGVLRADTPGEKASVDEGLKPALASHGLAVAAEFAVPPTVDGARAYSAAVLRFKQENITHVLFSRLGTPLFFGQSAEPQQYFPRYGIHTSNFPGSYLQFNMSAKTLGGSMGMGWQPVNDVDTQRDPGPPSDRAALCLKLMRQAGQDTSVRTLAALASWFCDSIFFIRDALERAPNFTPAGFRAGAEALTRYEAASTFRSGFAPGRLHDGAMAYRLFAFGAACGCFDYVTPVRPAP